MRAPDHRVALHALLILADGRLPVGGHVHSAGVEAALRDGRLADLDALADFVVGRLHTTALAEAAIVAATVCHLVEVAGPAVDVLGMLDGEAGARLPVPALRAASRRLGRQLARVAGRCWPDPVLGALGDVHPDGCHQPVALGAVAFVVGADATEAAMLSLHHSAQTPVQAALKLGGLDPFGLAALVAGLAPTIAELADLAAHYAAGPLADLPADTGLLVEIDAVAHDRRTDCLFAT